MNVPLAILVEYRRHELALPDLPEPPLKGKLLVRVLNEDDGHVYLYEFGHSSGATPELARITRVGRPSEAELAIVAALRSAPIVDVNGAVYSWEAPPGSLHPPAGF